MIPRCEASSGHIPCRHYADGQVLTDNFFTRWLCRAHKPARLGPNQRWIEEKP